MGVERCPTCDQPLPAGLSRAQLLKKVEGEREREISAALARQRPKIEADALARLMPKAKAEARKELQTEIAKAHAEGQQEGKQALALERKRRDRAEQTADQLKRQIKKLQTQLSAASPHDRGVIAQQDVARAIGAACREDEVSEVPRGQRGADVIQDVRDKGRPCGRILWESKDQADWNEAWVAKAKDDSRRVGADYTVIVTTAFPARTKTLTVRQGVVLVTPELAGTFAGLVHDVVVGLADAKATGTERAVKASKILDYVASADCRGRFEAVKDAVAELRKIQANERSYHDKHWTKEEQLFTQIAAEGGRVRERLEEIAHETPVRLVAKA